MSAATLAAPASAAGDTTVHTVSRSGHNAHGDHNEGQSVTVGIGMYDYDATILTAADVDGWVRVNVPDLGDAADQWVRGSDVTP